jgi:hypothetical protein
MTEAAIYDSGRSTRSRDKRTAEVVSRGRKHHCCAALCILLITVILPAVVMGCGSVASYSEIRTWHDLDSIRNKLSDNYVLMNSLDSTTAGYGEFASAMANQGKGWQPIGTADEPFAGSFDGQGHEVASVFINRPDGYSVGLFGAIDGAAVIRNVEVLNAEVTGEWAVGCLVGENWGDVSNSNSSGAVSGGDSAGGLVGDNAGSVNNCYSAADVTGHWDVGGLVGCSDSTGTISNSYSTGSVMGEWAVGGLTGGNLGGTVARSYSVSVVIGDDYVGGLVGDNQGTVSNSYSAGGVSGEWYVGGLVGDNDSTGVVSSSFATSNVTGDSFVGGLVGSNWGTVSDSFWDTGTSGVNESDGGTGQTTAAMQDITTFADTSTEGLVKPWDITAVAAGETIDSFIWNIVTGQTYPFLGWQPPAY